MTLIKIPGHSPQLRAPLCALPCAQHPQEARGGGAPPHHAPAHLQRCARGNQDLHAWIPQQVDLNNGKINHRLFYIFFLTTGCCTLTSSSDTLASAKQLSPPLRTTRLLSGRSWTEFHSTGRDTGSVRWRRFCHRNLILPLRTHPGVLPCWITRCSRGGEFQSERHYSDLQ